jgi:transposase
MDNAKIHKAKETLEQFKKMNLQIIFIAPYTPQLAPVEFLFAHLKQNLTKCSSASYDREVRTFIICFINLGRMQRIYNI